MSPGGWCECESGHYGAHCDFLLVPFVIAIGIAVPVAIAGIGFILICMMGILICVVACAVRRMKLERAIDPSEKKKLLSLPPEEPSEEQQDAVGATTTPVKKERTAMLPPVREKVEERLELQEMTISGSNQ